jgi:hypothetical protein
MPRRFVGRRSQTEQAGEYLVRLPGSSTTTAARQAFLAEMQRDAQRNLETAVGFLLRPRQRGLSLLDRWLRPEPAKTDYFFVGVNKYLIDYKLFMDTF